MTRVYNFAPGPAALPEEVLKQAAAEMLDWHGSGLSVMEMSHRGKEFMSILEQTQNDLRELLAIPANYKTLFLQGGAIAENAIVPMNLVGRGLSRGSQPDIKFNIGNTAPSHKFGVNINSPINPIGNGAGQGRGPVIDFIHTGQWSAKSIKEAGKYATVNVAASSESTKFTSIPPRETWRLTPGAAYVHICSNETIGGVEYQFVPDVGNVPLVADMSSNILSRVIDVSQYGVIYGGAQKNIGPAGVTLVIVREDLLGHALPICPSAFDWQVVAQNDSMYNTPPTYAIYIAGLVFQWLKRQGGVAAIEQQNVAKAALLYDYLDKTDFYRNPVARDARSRMNVPFVLRDDSLNDDFLAGAKERGLLQLKGHKSVGGMRASIYNAMPIEGVRALVDYLKEFEKKRG